MKIAYFSPLPPQKSGVADYSANLLPALLQHWEITLFVEQASVELQAGTHALPIRLVDSFRGLIDERYSMCIYQMGNNIRFHKRIFETLLRNPGVVVLHDPNLHAFHLDYAMQQECPHSQLVRDFGFGYRNAGLDYARQLLSVDAVRHDERYPLSTRIAQVSTGVIVHSEYARRMVLRDAPSAQVMVTQQPVSPLKRTLSKVLAKAQLGLPAEAILLSSFGYASPNKHIHSVIAVLAKLKNTFPELHYAVVGQPIPGYDLTKQIKALGLEQFVHLTGYVDKATYTNYLLATDIGINLRFPTTGETSAALLSMMAASIPCVIANVDAFSELPDEAVVKVQPGAEIEEELLSTLAALIRTSEWSESLSEGARRYILSQADPATVAAKYAKFVAESVHLRTRGESQ